MFSTPAIRGDVTAVVIRASIALDAIRIALVGLQNKEDITPHIEILSEQIIELDEVFDDLTGWKPDAD